MYITQLDLFSADKFSFVHNKQRWLFFQSLSPSRLSFRRPVVNPVIHDFTIYIIQAELITLMTSANQYLDKDMKQ